MMDKKWIEIDYCPECRWVWLDRWELEKLVQGEKNYNKEVYENNSYDEQKNYQKSHDWYKHHKKRSFLDWFDFFD